MPTGIHTRGMPKGIHTVDFLISSEPRHNITDSFLKLHIKGLEGLKSRHFNDLTLLSGTL